MKNTTHPLSLRSLLSFLGIDFTLGALLSWAANAVQILTVQNGLIIFSTIFATSLVILTVRVIRYQKATIDDINSRLASMSNQNANLQRRLHLVIEEIRSRSAVNPRPMAVNAWISTSAFQRSSVQVQAVEIRPNIIVLDKGMNDGLAGGMYFAVHRRNDGHRLEICPIEFVEREYAWLSHSGNNIPTSASPRDLTLQPVTPPNLTETEKELGQIILLAQGFGEG